MVLEDYYKEQFGEHGYQIIVTNQSRGEGQGTLCKTEQSREWVSHIRTEIQM